MNKFDKDLCSVQEARDLARAGERAAQEFATFSQEQVDAILKSMKEAAEKFSVCLAKAAVEETGFGTVADKAYKNHAAGTLLYEEIKDEKTVGIIAEDTTKGTLDVAEPVGLVLGIIPSTNPTSTVITECYRVCSASCGCRMYEEGCGHDESCCRSSRSTQRHY
jgi:acetaldehyde dehydrogenase (acetylating)